MRMYKIISSCLLLMFVSNQKVTSNFILKLGKSGIIADRGNIFMCLLAYYEAMLGLTLNEQFGIDPEFRKNVLNSLNSSEFEAVIYEVFRDVDLGLFIIDENEAIQLFNETKKIKPECMDMGNSTCPEDQTSPQSLMRDTMDNYFKKVYDKHTPLVSHVIEGILTSWLQENRTLEKPTAKEIENYNNIRNNTNYCIVKNGLISNELFEQAWQAMHTETEL